MNMLLKGTSEFPYLQIEDFYTIEEQDTMWEELEYLRPIMEATAVADSGEATSREGERLAQKNSVFLDDFYLQDRSKSSILQINRKLLNRLDDIVKVYKTSSSHLLLDSTYDSTLLNYYEEGGYYRSHYDRFCSHTAVTWLYRKPKEFIGGSLKLDQSGETIPCNNNTLVLFPSFYIHSVDPISPKPGEAISNGAGRYSIVQFIGEKDEGPM